jgi:hypothetical protein
MPIMNVALNLRRLLDALSSTSEFGKCRRSVGRYRPIADIVN